MAGAVKEAVVSSPIPSGASPALIEMERPEDDPPGT